MIMVRMATSTGRPGGRLLPVFLILAAWLLVQIGATLEESLQLPGWFDGLGFQGSYTILDSEQQIPITNSAGRL